MRPLGWVALQKVMRFEAAAEGKMVDWGAAVDGTIVRMVQGLIKIDPPATPLSLGLRQHLDHLGGAANLIWEDW